MSLRQIFGAVLASILLGLFVFLLWEAYQTAEAILLCGDNDECIDLARARFSLPMETGLNLIGGLVAAIVVAELAITKSNDLPAWNLFSSGEGTTSDVARWLASAYIALWVVTGLFAYVWAGLKHPDAVKPLTDYGNAWLGTAVAAGYSFFGIRPRT